jgi:hypothetical protein
MVRKNFGEPWISLVGLSLLVVKTRIYNIPTETNVWVSRCFRQRLGKVLASVRAAMKISIENGLTQQQTRYVLRLA